MHRTSHKLLVWLTVVVGSIVIFPATAAAAEREGPGYAVFLQPWMERGNHLTLPEAGVADGALDVFAVPGEYVPASFSIRPDRALAGVTVELTGALAGAEGGEIPASALTIRMVERMKRWLRADRFEKHECFLPRAVGRNLAANTTYRYWLTLRVPEQTAPGLYSGHLRIRADNAAEYTLPLRVEVAPVSLAPAEGMTYMMYFSSSYLPAELFNERFFAMAYEDMREHGMTGTTVYAAPGGPGWQDVERDARPNYLPMARQIGLLNEAGLPAPRAPLPWVLAEYADLATWKHVQEQARRRNWPEFLFYLVDEPGNDPKRVARVEKVMEQAGQFRERWPELAFRTTTAAPGDEVWHHYDVVITGTAPDVVRRLREEHGKEVWSYQCSLSPVDAHTSRHYFGLWAWKTGVKGVSFWAYYDHHYTDRAGLRPPWTGAYEGMREYTHFFNFVYPTSEEIVPSIGWEAIREGVNDYRFLVTLEKTAALAREQGADAELVRPAFELLAEIADLIDPQSLATARARVPALGPDGRRPAGALRAWYFERPPPQAELTAAAYDQLRRRLAGEIARLNRAGFAYRSEYQPLRRPIVYPSVPVPAYQAPTDPGTEILWQACDDLDVRAQTFRQPAWRPTSQAGTEIGEVEVCTEEKVVGAGSIRWRVTRADIDKRREEGGRFAPISGRDAVTLNYLHGKDFQPYIEVRFHIRCESANHPPLDAWLDSNRYRVLERDEVTDGWKEIRWVFGDDFRLPEGKYGRLIWLFRLTTEADAFQPGDILDIRLDNLRLVTGVPVDVTGDGPSIP